MERKKVGLGWRLFEQFAFLTAHGSRYGVPRYWGLCTSSTRAAGGANQNHSAKIKRAQVYDPKCKACMTVKAGGNARGAHTCDRSTTGGKGYGPRKSTGD